MALRITQGILYSASVNGMNRSLNALYESNLQASSELRINRPSDDPLGAGRVITSRLSLAKMEQYQNNISEATGWLSSCDSVLSSEGSVMTILTKMKELAEQGATGTYNDENRKEMSYELRQLYEQLLTASNSTYNGSYIFSGQKTDTQAYVAGLGVKAVDSSGNLDGVTFQTEGGADYTVLIQATSTGPAESATYRYSNDGGSTWNDISASEITWDYPETGRVRIAAGGASVIMDMGVTVTAVNTDNVNSTDNGTWLYIRPTGVYQGDDNDTQVTLAYGNSTNQNTGDISASGHFSQDVAVRIESNDGANITYSYSSNSGLTWTQATTPAPVPATDPVKLPVAGGYLDLAEQPAAGEQYIIHPHRAEVTIAISDNTDIALNLVGKNVFGGVYTNPVTGEREVVSNNTANIFEIAGDLVAAAETGSQSGMAQAVEDLTDAMSVVLTAAATVGGRENRLTVTSNMLELRSISETDRLSSIEDVDLTELLTRITSQQTTYSAVLQTSSMIMKQSLLNYL